MAKKKIRIRLTAAQGRQRIIEAALDIIAKVGWDDTSIQAIADECGVSQSNVLYHFKSKAGLLHALVQHIKASNYQLVSAALKPEHNAFERICIHISKNLEWGRKFPKEAQVLILIYYQATHDKIFSLLFSEILTTAQNRIYEYVLSGQREKLFHLTCSPDVTAKVLHNVLVGAFINLVAGRLAGQKDYKDSDWQKVIATLTGYQKASVRRE
jgi:AcrR family transcriptional regulator